MKMNKKAAVMFWVIPIFVAAIALYLVFSDTISLAAEPKGTWHLDFLNKNYLQAEKNLLQLDSTVKNIGIETAWELSANGGFLEGQKSECGLIDETNLWNLKEKPCFPNIEKNVQKRVAVKLKKRLEGRNFNNIKYRGRILSAKGEKETIETDLGSYTYDTSFAVDLGYSFDEYIQLWDTAVKMISNCKNKDNLKPCLDKEKPDYWKYSSCNPAEEKFSDNERKVKFCINSPNLYYLGPKLVTYEIAFDFSE